MRLRSLLFLLLCLLPFATARAGATTPTEAAAIAAAQQDHTAYTLPPDKLATAQHLSHIAQPLHFVSIAWSILMLVLILQTGVVARMRNLAVNLFKNRWAQGYTFFFLFLLVTMVLDLPVSVGHQHLLRAYGFSVQSWPSWVFDQIKTFLLTWLIGGLLIMIVFWRIRRSPRRWWLQAWAVSCVFVVIGIFITPYVIDPLFNKFEPLTAHNPALVQQLERVVARGKGISIPPERMFLMKASAKLTTLNAYVTGFGASKRVVVWDTSIAKATPDQITFIFGHEMGHYVLGHILLGVLFSFVLTFFSFWLGFLFFQYLLRRFGPRWRVPSQDNWAALPVFILVLSLFAFFTEPIQSTFRRMLEHNADVYGQEVVHGIVADPQAAAQGGFQVLGENSLVDPHVNAFYDFWTDTHPAIPFRAAFARHYDPWAPNAQPKYFPR